MSDKLAPIAANQSTAELAIWLDRLLQGDRVYHSDYQKFTESANRLRTQSAQIAQLQAEVEALRKYVEWQPIETAPKDGTPVLIFGGIQHPEVGNSRTITRATLANWSTSSECWLVLDCDYYSVSIENPTHWMPLPKPPTATAKDTQLDALGEMVKLSQEMGFYEQPLSK